MERKFLVTLFVALVVLAQAQDGLVIAANCRVKCLFKCARHIFKPHKYEDCVFNCIAGCMCPPSDALMNCTTNCAKSAFRNHHPDSKTMRGFVNGCYNSCKHRK